MTDESSTNLPEADDIEVLSTVLAALRKLQPEQREKLIHTVATYFDLQISGRSSLTNTNLQGPANGAVVEGSFSEDRTISPKEFLWQKQPRTDVERVACLAYYLAHYRETPHFKTLDLSKLNTEAAQVKFSNAAVAVENATKSGYLVPATKGNKQISAQGEVFVRALPDRDAARDAMANMRPRRRSRKQSTPSLESSWVSDGNDAQVDGEDEN